MTGRGRGESKHIHKLDEADEQLERDRQAQMEAARIIGLSEGDIPIRGRGGFRQAELRTIPANATSVVARHIQGARQVDIMANFVQVTSMAKRSLYMYRVDFEPQIESASSMRFLFKTAAGKLFNKPPIYDGMYECRTYQKLAEKISSATVTDERDGETKEYKITFTHTGDVAFGAESLRIYNMHMKEFLRTMGFYQPQTGIYVHDKLASEINPELMMMRGFRTSANIHDEGKTLMNLEAAHKLMQRNNVLRVMSQIKQRAGTANLAATLNAELSGKLVVSSYDKRAYRIEEVRLNMNPQSTFECQGRNISFFDYYKEKKQVEIRELSQPLLLVVPNNQRRREEVTRETFLVPELCNLAGLTEAQRNDFRLRNDLIRASQVHPNDRVKHLKEFLQQFHSNQDIKTKLAEWGYEYAKDPITLKAHVIQPTKVAFGRSCRDPPTNWPSSNPETADIRNDGLAQVPTIKKMAFIIARNDAQSKSQIMDHLKSGFQQVQLQAGNVLQVDLQSDQPSEYIRAIRNLPADVEVAILVLSKQNKDRYDAIKKAASVERGLITQVVTARLMTTEQRKARSAATKIAIQIAAKVGGEPWWADIPLKGAMVCGYDTYHDTSQRGRSYGAFLASMNAHYSRWWSKADTHDKLEEISAQVATNMTEAVKQYRKFNKNEFPERVIIYRDGVGEGQLEHVFKVELTHINKALSSVGSPKKIALTMIVVNKRIGARFYMRANTGVANPPPGTVIDHTVTRSERYDFYLVSQSTRQGSITPTYYNIIHDECGFPPEVHQKMAYKFCLLYYNWSGTVRVPAPCQYAHKLALLCGEHLHGQPHSVLDDKLHFL